EELVVVGAVRLVAREAVLTHRRVLPQERPALLRVAREAEVVDRLGRDHLRLRAVVRVVAARAAELPFAHPVVRDPLPLPTDRRMAREARLLLGRRLELGFDGLRVVHAVTRRAREALPLVHAAVPARLAALVVTGQAGRRDLLGGRGLQRDDRAQLAL